MQHIRLGLVVFMLGLSGPAIGGQPGCTNCNGSTSVDYWLQRGLGAEACAAPCGYCLVPGCCEDARRCCDNAWAGYCDHRARVEAFWTRVGTPHACCRARPCRPAQCPPCLASEPCPTSNSMVPSSASMLTHTRR